MPFATEIDPTEQVGAGLAAGVTAQVRETPDALNPFDGVMVMSDVADCPAAIEEGESAPAESAKPAVIDTTLDVLLL